MCACIFDAVTLVVCSSDVSRLPAPDVMQPNQQLRAAAARHGGAGNYRVSYFAQTPASPHV